MASNGDADAALSQPAQDSLVAGVASLTMTPPTEDKAAEEQPLPHRSHDPQFNQKRTDPFQFGSRYLQEQDDVFEFNAWDHVETDDAYKEYAEQQFAMQRQSPVNDFDKCKFYFFSLYPTPGTLVQGSGVNDDLHHSIVHLNFL